MQHNLQKVFCSISCCVYVVMSYKCIYIIHISVLYIYSFSILCVSDIGSSTSPTVASALISHHNPDQPMEHGQPTTAVHHSTTIDIQDLSITTDQDGEESVFRDTITSPATSFLPTASTSTSHNPFNPSSLTPLSNKPAPGYRRNRGYNNSRGNFTLQALQDYITGERQWPCGLTNFHFSLCFGMVGFTVFWTGLLLRIYLPHEYFT